MKIVQRHNGWVDQARIITNRIDMVNPLHHNWLGNMAAEHAWLETLVDTWLDTWLDTWAGIAQPIIHYLRHFHY